MQMSDSVQERLQALEDVTVLQESPFLVTLPRSLEGVRSVLSFARASDLKVLPLGSGSSFPADYALTRKNVVALMMTGVSGVDEVGSFSVRIWAGTALASVVPDYRGERATVGGVLSDGMSADSSRRRRSLMTRLKSVDVMLDDGRIETCVHSEGACGERATCAALVLGCSGRCGVIVSALFRAPLSELVKLLEHAEPELNSMTPAREICLTKGDVYSALDSGGLFQW